MNSDSVGTALDEKEVVAAVRRATGQSSGALALHEPTFAGNEWDYVRACLDTGWVSSAGKFVDRFERQLEDFTGASRAIATGNGTSALHICLILAGVERGDEVLLPSLTFVATANAIVYCGAIPHFVDSEESTLGIDPDALGAYLREIGEVRKGQCYNRRTGRKIPAVIVMHTFGHPADLDRIGDVIAEYHIALIEDAAESLGSYYKGRHTGTYGRLSALSFNGNKIVTTGGGGAILTNDEKLGAQAKHLTTTARLPHRWSFIHDEVGYNYRLPNLNAALGCAQLEQLPRFIEEKRRLADRYRHAFCRLSGLRFFEEPSHGRSNYWLNAVLIQPDFATDFSTRESLLGALNEAGIMARPAWTLMHRLPIYAGCPRMELPTASSIERRLINLPSSAALAKAAQGA